MFWPNPYNQSLVNAHCAANWGLLPRTLGGAAPGDQSWVVDEYGGRQLLQGHSNIVFSSGSFDGWSAGGVATNDTAARLHSFLIQGGAHHLDLMFSHPDDPASVVTARQFELAEIRQWLAQYSQAPPLEAQSWGDVL